MDFIKKAELFFIQLQYCLTIEPEPILQNEKGLYSLMLKPDIFLKLINDFQIEYPFIPENKIIELKCLMSKENIDTENALKIIENYKKQYWFLDTVTMFEPVTDKLIRTLKSIDSNISEKEINIELINYQKHLQGKREQIYSDLVNEIQALPPQPIIKQKPELNEKLITFKNSETIDKIHSELKGYFPNKEAELLKALKGEQLGEILLFPHNQNKFVEVFRRLKYNGFLLNSDTETKNWICTTFQFVKKGFAEPQPFNESSVWVNLNKGKGEPTRKERICITEWLPYKSPLQLTREAKNEKL